MAGEPRTAAGRALRDWLAERGITAVSRILAIEAEAIAAARERIEADWKASIEPDPHRRLARDAVYRSVLAALAAPSDAPEKETRS